MLRREGGGGGGGKLERSRVCSEDYSSLPPVIFHMMQMLKRPTEQLVRFSSVSLTQHRGDAARPETTEEDN